MNDPEAIKRLVEHARREAAEEHLAEQSQAEAASRNAVRNKAAASELNKTLPGELLSICMASSGAMHWASESLSGGGTEFQLKWIDPPPTRILSLVVEDAGIVLWGWFTDWLEPTYNRMPAAGLTQSLLMAFVEALADEASWEARRVPELKLGPASP